MKWFLVTAFVLFFTPSAQSYVKELNKALTEQLEFSSERDQKVVESNVIPENERTFTQDRVEVGTYLHLANFSASTDSGGSFDLSTLSGHALRANWELESGGGYQPFIFLDYMKLDFDDRNSEGIAHQDSTHFINFASGLRIKINDNYNAVLIAKIQQTPFLNRVNGLNRIVKASLPLFGTAFEGRFWGKGSWLLTGGAQAFFNPPKDEADLEIGWGLQGGGNLDFEYWSGEELFYKVGLFFKYGRWSADSDSVATDVTNWATGPIIQVGWIL